MAELSGEGKLPEERPAWGRPLRNLTTDRGISDLEKALSGFCPYTTEELWADQGLLLKTARETKPFTDNAVEETAQRIFKVHTKERLLQMDPLDMAFLIDKALLEKYPEIAEVKNYSEAFVFNDFKEKVLAYILAVVATSEKRHREMGKTSKGRKINIPGVGRGYEAVKTYTHGKFFGLIDNPEQLFRMVPQCPDSKNMLLQLQRLRMQYIAIRDFWIPFLRGKNGAIRNPENKTSEELKAENDKIARMFFAESNREIPMCTIENETLIGKDNPLVMQVSPIDDEALGMFYSTAAQVDYFEPEMGEAIRSDRAAQEFLRPQKMSFGQGVAPMDLVAHIGKFPAIFLDRISGELKGANVGTIALKFIAGKGASYELLRRDILFYLAQLTCDRSVLEKMFGSMFAINPKNKNGQTSVNSVQGEDPEKDSKKEPNPSTETTRIYPRSEDSEDAFTRGRELREALDNPGNIDSQSPLQDDGSETGEALIEDVNAGIEETLEKVQRETEVGGYKRLLTLIKRKDEKGNVRFITPKASKKAIDGAATAGKALRKGLEFIKTGEVVKPKDIEDFLRGFGVSTLEELQDIFPDEIAIIEETWVGPFKRGNPEHGIIQTIKAAVKGSTEDPVI